LTRIDERFYSLGSTEMRMVSSGRASTAIGAILAVLLTGHADASEPPMRIGWGSLLPPSASPLATGRAALGERLAWDLAGKQVELTGFLLPSDREGDKVFEFLLVPWAGACSHMPAPPPNQVVLVTPAQPYQASGSYEVVTISGALIPDLTKTQLFILDGVKVVESGYRVSRAHVSHANGPDDGKPVGPTPWEFLNN
jgi:hypothetical protein